MELTYTLQLVELSKKVGAFCKYIQEEDLKPVNFTESDLVRFSSAFSNITRKFPTFRAENGVNSQEADDSGVTNLSQNLSQQSINQKCYVKLEKIIKEEKIIKTEETVSNTPKLVPKIENFQPAADDEIPFEILQASLASAKEDEARRASQIPVKQEKMIKPEPRAKKERQNPQMKSIVIESSGDEMDQAQPSRDKN